MIRTSSGFTLGLIGPGFLTLVLSAFAGVANGTLITHATTFGSTTSGVGIDGRSVGYSNPGGTTFDTNQGWTWYTEISTTNDNLTIPFAADGGLQTIGEQGIRVGGGLELQSTDYFFGYAGPSTAIALRSQTYNDVGVGTANVSWTTVSSTSGFFAYYSQNGGTSWTALTNGANFAAALGSIEVVFVGNDGADSNTQLQTATISYQAVPEPSSLTMLLFGSVMLWFAGRNRNA